MDSSTASNVLTRGADERTTRNRLLDRAPHGLAPRAAWFVPHRALATLGAAELATSSAVELNTALQVLLPSRFVKAWWSPVDEALAHEARQAAARRELTTRLHDRIAELKRAGVEEGLPWSSASEDDFWSFVALWPTLREPGLILMDNGNLRAVWRNAVREQVALEFRGDRRVHFVFFARRPEGPPMARSAGEDSIARIGEKIAGDNLTGLLRGEG
jgi:hypothetical protein